MHVMLEGPNVILRAWQESDVPFCHALRNDVESQLSLMAEPRPHTMHQARAWLEARSALHDGVFFIIVARPEGDPSGFIELRGIQTLHGHASLGLCLTRGSRGKGWAAESLGLLEQYANQVLGLHKIVLQVLTENRSAITVYERAGYQQVGVYRRHFRRGQTRHDVSIWEKLLDETLRDVAVPWTQ